MAAALGTAATAANPDTSETEKQHLNARGFENMAVCARGGEQP